MGRSVNRRVSYAADLIASNEELEFPHTKSFIAGLVFFLLPFSLSSLLEGLKCQILIIIIFLAYVSTGAPMNFLKKFQSIK